MFYIVQYNTLTNQPYIIRVNYKFKTKELGTIEVLRAKTSMPILSKEKKTIFLILENNVIS